MTRSMAVPLAAVDPDKVTPGVLGFLVVFGLAVATWLLLRSMTRQLKRIDIPEPAEPAPAAEPARPAQPTDTPETEAKSPPSSGPADGDAAR